MSDLIEVRRMAEALLHTHLDASWTFAFDNAKRRAGACDYTRGRITVSRYLAARYDDETNRQTLLHEVAHALAGARAGHGPVWKRTARGLGYTGGTTHYGETATELAPWVGVCPVGHVAYRHRRATRATSCAVCSPTFDARFLFTWTRREITPATRLAAMTPRDQSTVERRTDQSA
ncbi:SprT-like domain-containing protein [Microbacterium flavum]|uniref:SprT-like domain-containing protein n=1 Tax=Microbacterium flavum TaxID=415216 RepID=A0ABS5XSZ1_9MICO|nr:SprT-like domain-containing protein [Microbacterium flavum]MBT8797635.1 SprT-like domain-containing protein [Microbacterium flavum]